MCVHLNGVRNRGGGILKGYQGRERRRGHKLNTKLVKRGPSCWMCLSCTVVWWGDGGRRKRSSEVLHLRVVNSHTQPFATEVWDLHVWRGRPHYLPPVRPSRAETHRTDIRTNPLLNICLSRPSIEQPSVTLCDRGAVASIGHQLLPHNDTANNVHPNQ